MVKLITIIILITMTNICLAFDTCPTPEEISQSRYNGFRAYANENGTPITGDKLKQFEKNVAAFYSVRWLAGAFEGEAHCYYTNKSGRWTHAFLSKPGLIPDKTSQAWYEYHGEPRCHKSLSTCRLINDN